MCTKKIVGTSPGKKFSLVAKIITRWMHQVPLSERLAKSIGNIRVYLPGTPYFLILKPGDEKADTKNINVIK